MFMRMRKRWAHPFADECLSPAIVRSGAEEMRVRGTLTDSRFRIATDALHPCNLGFSGFRSSPIVPALSSHDVQHSNETRCNCQRIRGQKTESRRCHYTHLSRILTCTIRGSTASVAFECSRFQVRECWVSSGERNSPGLTHP